MRKPTILLAEHEETFRRQLQSFLLCEGFEVCAVPDTTGILRTLRQRRVFDLLLVNAYLGGVGGGLEAAQLIRQGDSNLPIIVIAAESSEDLVIAALRAGMNDYLKHPLTHEELLASLRRCLPRISPPQASDKGSTPVSKLIAGERMIGESPQMQGVKAYISRVAVADSNALITGETGTGKELVAALIHQNSRRRRKPFVSVNCAAIPDSLLESELFGYERGAFTGAERLREGVLKDADGGTIFFDEIGDMSPYAQAKILRAIESKEIRRLGGKGSLPLDLRVVAATNRNLEQLMAEEKFRADLYFRLNVANIHLPPLRERKEDLLVLVNHYIQHMNRQFAQQVEGLTEEALAFFLHYDWPGNVRELRNLIEAIFINLPPRWIAVADFPEQFRRRVSENAHLPQDERDRLLQALFATNWNKRLAAQKLHWSRMTLYRKMTKYHIVSGGKESKTHSTARETDCHTSSRNVTDV